MQPCGDGCLLRWEKVTDRLEISVSTSDLEMNVGFIPTNDDICSFVEENYGFKVHSAYIGQVKAKLGIREHENYHDSHTGKRKPCVCPPIKEAAIKAALEHYGYI